MDYNLSSQQIYLVIIYWLVADIVVIWSSNSIELIKIILQKYDYFIS